ncbi:MAG TPA: YihY/virulence factor BrkB family protein [Candidatus Saccharimonadales bacterium]|jgi:YihY family inner membrane protein
MKFLDSAKSAVDTYQQKHAVLAFSVAVIKRYGDDKAGRQAALITYYAFLALFPLLLVFITVLSIVASGDPELQKRISGEVFQYFPAMSSSIQNSVHTLKGSGVVLALEILALLYGARGLAAMLQEAFNNVWHVDKQHRPNFVGDNLRSFAMMFSVGIGIIIGTVVSYGLSSILDIGIIGAILITIVNLAIVFGLFLVVFRLGTSNRIRLHWLVPGALIAASGLLLVQHFGTRIMSQQLPKLNDSYGSFALTLGIMFWIYIQSQIIIYALVITAVRAQKDWPKPMFDDTSDT